MTLSLASIEVEAFKAFAAPTTLQLGALPPGLHMVRGRNRTNDRLGSNGSGKSSFFSDAITWCLFGRTAGGLRTTDVRSWLTKKPPRVAVKLNKCAVQRGPRANDLTIDGRQVGQRDVDALVGLSYEAWCQAVVMGQGAPLFLDLPPAAKMALLSDALGLERWERRAQAAGARARRLEDRRLGLEGEERGLRAALEAAQAALQSARDASERWGREHSARLEEIASRAKSERSRADALEGRRGEASLAADSAGTAAKTGRPLVDALRAEVGRLEGQAAGARREVDQARAELRRAEGALAAFAEEGRCPTCGQAVGDKAAARHAVRHRAEVARLAKFVKKLESSGKDYTTTLAAKTGQLERESARLAALEEAEGRASAELRLLERTLAEARARAHAAEADRRNAEEETNPHREAAQLARRRAGEVERELAERRELVGRLAASIERAQFWSRGFRDIRLGIIDDVLDDLRGTTAEVLDGLGLGDWAIEYSTEHETKSGGTQRALAVAVRSPAAPEGVRWEVYSGGERQRLRLAGALALSEVLLAHAGTSIDLRVLDEPTRGLSREGVQDLVEVLGDYARRGGLRVLYIDHQSEEGLAFASAITVVNEAAGARIEAD